MVAPKRKVSKQRGHTRYANWKIAKPTVGECPQCHESKPSHRVCKHCGYYDGVSKVEIKQKTKE